VLAKTPLHLSFEGLDLVDHRSQDSHQGADAGAVGLGNHLRQLELFPAQGGGDLLGAHLKVALPAAPAERADQPAPGQRPPGGGSGCGGEHRQRVRTSQIGAERRQRRGVELAQHRPQLVGLPLPGPDQRLVGPRECLDGLGVLTVPGHGPVVLAVLTDDLGQHVRVGRIALRPRRRVTLAIARNLLRVDRINHITGRDQRLHPTAAVGLDPDQHRGGFIVLAQVVGYQRVQLRQTRDSLWKPASAQHPPVLSLELDVVMGLGPVIS
jgi:hypothetical protein